MGRYVKSFGLYEAEKFAGESLNERNESFSTDWADFEVKGKKLIVDFKDLDSWDSTMYGGGKGKRAAFQDIKAAAEHSNDPLLDDIETAAEQFSSSQPTFGINWDKPIRLTNGGKSLEFILESESVNEGFFAIAGGIILAVLGLKVLKSIAKKVLIKVGSNIDVKPEKLIRLVDTIQEEAILNGGLKGKSILVLHQWANDLKEKINNGTIKTIGEIRDSIDPAAKEMFT